MTHKRCHPLDQYSRSAEKINKDIQIENFYKIFISDIKYEINELEDLKNIFEIGKSEKYKKSLHQNVSERKKRLKNKLKSNEKEYKNTIKRINYNSEKLDSARNKLI